MDLGAVLPFGLENLLIGFSTKNLISLWIKKAPLWSRRGEPIFYTMKNNQLFYVLFLGESLWTKRVDQ